MDEQQIRALLNDVLGTAPIQITAETNGQQSSVWSARMSECNVIVRTHAILRHYSSTQNNLRILAQLGLPVPRVLVSDVSGSKYPFAYMILESIRGRDLKNEIASMSEAQTTRLAKQVAAFQRAVANLPPGTGYGWVGIGEEGPYSTWWDLFHRAPDTASALAVDGEYNIVTARLKRLVTHFEPYLRDVPPTCFLDDITVKNVIVDAGELQGLIDFDFVCYGDPLHWLGLTATTIVCDIGSRHLFYVEELQRFLDLTDVQRNVVLLYSAIIALGFVKRYRQNENEEWSKGMIEAIDGWVEQLERNIGHNRLAGVQD